ncbi:MAG TPA: sigma-54-dependent Fis family transcriptional regulator [bacterium]|nr:sigma-54-dependent Fis family transcriptional regulator [bacterium]
MDGLVSISHLLEALKAGYAFLDPELRIVRSNARFRETHPSSPSLQDLPVFDVLPETVGLEEVLKALRSGEKTSFTLQYIAREASPDILYLRLVLVGTRDPEKPVLVVLSDETEQARILQRVQQQSFEIRLMRSLLNEKQAALAAGLIGSSGAMVRLRNTIEKLSAIPSSTILIRGETGTGKSLVARMIHLSTDLRDRPFVEFNCAAVPESLLESELFGHEKGAFTHAVSQKKGLLEEADDGTLFLDEIGDIRLNLQAKLLTVLDSRKFRRLGSIREINTRFRLIAATHRDLRSMVKEGSFREDLYYRIQVITLDCPPLRNLEDDVIRIARHFIQVYAREFGKPVAGLTPEAENKLKGYRWPGNVRELRNVIERAMIFTENPSLDSRDIQLQSTGEDAPVQTVETLPDGGLSFEELERRLLKQALERARGNQSRAARLLKMSRDTFRYRLEKHKLLE